MDFYVRNGKTVTIPYFIEHICTSAFNCCKLRKVEIERNSQFRIIDENAFSESLIEIISIPSKVEIIKEESFYLCQNLKKVEFESESEI